MSAYPVCCYETVYYKSNDVLKESKYNWVGSRGFFDDSCKQVQAAFDRADIYRRYTKVSNYDCMTNLDCGREGKKCCGGTYCESGNDLECKDNVCKKKVVTPPINNNDDSSSTTAQDCSSFYCKAVGEPTKTEATFECGHAKSGQSSVWVWLYNGGNHVATSTYKCNGNGNGQPGFPNHCYKASKAITYTFALDAHGGKTYSAEMYYNPEFYSRAKRCKASITIPKADDSGAAVIVGEDKDETVIADVGKVCIEGDATKKTYNCRKSCSGADLGVTFAGDASKNGVEKCTAALPKETQCGDGTALGTCTKEEQRCVLKRDGTGNAVVIAVDADGDSCKKENQEAVIADKEAQEKWDAATETLDNKDPGSPESKEATKDLKDSYDKLCGDGVENKDEAKCNEMAQKLKDEQLKNGLSICCKRTEDGTGEEGAKGSTFTHEITDDAKECPTGSQKAGSIDECSDEEVCCKKEDSEEGALMMKSECKTEVLSSTVIKVKDPPAIEGKDSTPSPLDPNKLDCSKYKSEYDRKKHGVANMCEHLQKMRGALMEIDAFYFGDEKAIGGLLEHLRQLLKAFDEQCKNCDSYYNEFKGTEYPTCADANVGDMGNAKNLKFTIDQIAAAKAEEFGPKLCDDAAQYVCLSEEARKCAFDVEGTKHKDALTSADKCGLCAVLSCCAGAEIHAGGFDCPDCKSGTNGELQAESMNKINPKEGPCKDDSDGLTFSRTWVCKEDSSDVDDLKEEDLGVKVFEHGGLTDELCDGSSSRSETCDSAYASGFTPGEAPSGCTVISGTSTTTPAECSKVSTTFGDSIGRCKKRIWGTSPKTESGKADNKKMKWCKTAGGAGKGPAMVCKTKDECPSSECTFGEDTKKKSDKYAANFVECYGYATGKQPSGSGMDCEKIGTVSKETVKKYTYCGEYNEGKKHWFFTDDYEDKEYKDYDAKGAVIEVKAAKHAILLSSALADCQKRAALLKDVCTVSGSKVFNDNKGDLSPCAMKEKLQGMVAFIENFHVRFKGSDGILQQIDTIGNKLKPTCDFTKTAPASYSTYTPEKKEASNKQVIDEYQYKGSSKPSNKTADTAHPDVVIVYEMKAIRALREDTTNSGIGMKKFQEAVKNTIIMAQEEEDGLKTDINAEKGVQKFDYKVFDSGKFTLSGSKADLAPMYAGYKWSLFEDNLCSPDEGACADAGTADIKGQKKTLGEKTLKAMEKCEGIYRLPQLIGRCIHPSDDCKDVDDDCEPDGLDSEINFDERSDKKNADEWKGSYLQTVDNLAREEMKPDELFKKIEGCFDYQIQSVDAMEECKDVSDNTACTGGICCYGQCTDAKACHAYDMACTWDETKKKQNPPGLPVSQGKPCGGKEMNGRCCWGKCRPGLESAEDCGDNKPSEFCMSRGEGAECSFPGQGGEGGGMCCKEGENLYCIKTKECSVSDTCYGRRVGDSCNGGTGMCCAGFGMFGNHAPYCETNRDVIGSSGSEWKKFGQSVNIFKNCGSQYQQHDNCQYEGQPCDAYGGGSGGGYQGGYQSGDQGGGWRNYNNNNQHRYSSYPGGGGTCCKMWGGATVADVDLVQVFYCSRTQCPQNDPPADDTTEEEDPEEEDEEADDPEARETCEEKEMGDFCKYGEDNNKGLCCTKDGELYCNTQVDECPEDWGDMTCDDKEEGELCLRNTENEGKCCKAEGSTVLMCWPGATKCNTGVTDPDTDPDNPVVCVGVCKTCAEAENSHCHAQTGMCVCERGNEWRLTSQKCNQNVQEPTNSKYLGCCRAMFEVDLSIDEPANTDEPYIDGSSTHSMGSNIIFEFKNPTESQVFVCEEWWKVYKSSGGWKNVDQVMQEAPTGCKGVTSMESIFWDQKGVLDDDVEDMEAGSYKIEACYCTKVEGTSCAAGAKKCIDRKFRIVDPSSQTGDGDQDYSMCIAPSSIATSVSFDKCQTVTSETGYCCKYGFKEEPISLSCSTDSCATRPDGTECQGGEGICKDGVCADILDPDDDECADMEDGEPCDDGKGSCNEGRCTELTDPDECADKEDGARCNGGEDICVDHRCVDVLDPVDECADKEDGVTCNGGNDICKEGKCVDVIPSGDCSGATDGDTCKNGLGICTDGKCVEKIPNNDECELLVDGESCNNGGGVCTSGKCVDIILPPPECYDKPNGESCNDGAGSCTEGECVDIIEDNTECGSKEDGLPCAAGAGICEAKNCVEVVSPDECRDKSDGTSCNDGDGVCEEYRCLEIIPGDECDGMPEGTSCGAGTGACIEGQCFKVTSGENECVGKVDGTACKDGIGSCLNGKCAKVTSPIREECLRKLKDNERLAVRCEDAAREADITCETDCMAEYIESNLQKDCLKSCNENPVLNDKIVACGMDESCLRVEKALSPDLHVTLRMMRGDDYSNTFYIGEESQIDVIIDNAGEFTYSGAVEVKLKTVEDCDCPECPTGYTCDCVCEENVAPVTTRDIALLRPGETFRYRTNAMVLDESYTGKSVQPYAVITKAGKAIFSAEGELVNFIEMGDLELTDAYFEVAGERTTSAYPGATAEGKIKITSEWFPLNVSVFMAIEGIEIPDSRATYTITEPVRDSVLATEAYEVNSRQMDVIIRVGVEVKAPDGTVVIRQILLEQGAGTNSCSGKVMTTKCETEKTQIEMSYPSAYLEVKALKLRVVDAIFKDMEGKAVNARFEDTQVIASMEVQNIVPFAFDGNIELLVMKDDGSEVAEAHTTVIASLAERGAKRTLQTSPFVAAIGNTYRIFLLAKADDGTVWNEETVSEYLFPYASLKVQDAGQMSGDRQDIKTNLIFASCQLNVECRECLPVCELHVDPNTCRLTTEHCGCTCDAR